MRHYHPTPPSKPPLVYETKGDGRDWARRILARHAAGEKLAPISIRWAKEALQALGEAA